MSYPTSPGRLHAYICHLVGLLGRTPAPGPPLALSKGGLSRSIDGNILVGTAAVVDTTYIRLVLIKNGSSQASEHRSWAYGRRDPDSTMGVTSYQRYGIFKRPARRLSWHIVVCHAPNVPGSPVDIICALHFTHLSTRKRGVH